MTVVSAAGAVDMAWESVYVYAATAAAALAYEAVGRRLRDDGGRKRYGKLRSKDRVAPWSFVSGQAQNSLGQFYMTYVLGRRGLRLSLKA